MAGARPHPACPLGGTGLARYLLRGEEPSERDLFWRVRGERAVRRGDGKHHRGRSGKDQLFHLTANRREQADRAPDEPKRLAELKAVWERTNAELLPYPSA